MRTLLHVCCGPCATATVAFWRGEGLSLTGYFYNPNIHPLLEFRRRMTGAEDLAEHANMEIILDRHYDPVEWFTDCLLYTSDAADDLTRVDLGGRRIIKKKKIRQESN